MVQVHTNSPAILLLKTLWVCAQKSHHCCHVWSWELAMVYVATDLVLGLYCPEIEILDYLAFFWCEIVMYSTCTFRPWSVQRYHPQILVWETVPLGNIHKVCPLVTAYFIIYESPVGPLMQYSMGIRGCLQYRIWLCGECLLLGRSGSKHNFSSEIFLRIHQKQTGMRWFLKCGKPLRCVAFLQR